MAQITLSLAVGRHVSFDVDLDAEGPAVFFLSVRRSGSSIFENITHAMSNANHRHHVAITTFFDADIPAPDWQSDPALKRLIAPGNVYGVFRDMPVALLDDELFVAGPRLMLIRDPRDALVSEYFAMAYSHPIPDSALGPGGLGHVIKELRTRANEEPIDDFVVRRCKPMARTLLRYQPIVNAGTTLYRYEDVILNKRDWILDMLGVLGWELHPDELANILEWADVKPEQENPGALLRRVTPGDHLEKLRPDTIERITEALAPAMTLFGYPT